MLGAAPIFSKIPRKCNHFFSILKHFDNVAYAPLRRAPAVCRSEQKARNLRLPAGFDQLEILEQAVGFQVAARAGGQVRRRRP
jgi:hypothetical protein